MGKITKLINAVLPPVPRTEDRQTLQFFSAIKQAIDELKTGVVVSDQGVVSRLGSKAAKDELAGVTAEAVTDPDALTTPSAVASLTASGTVTAINLNWSYGGPSVGFFEVHRNTVDAQGTAVIRGTTGATVFSDNAEPGVTYYYWVRGVSSGGVTGPFQSTAGVSAATVANPLTTLATAQYEIPVTNTSDFTIVADNFAVAKNTLIGSVTAADISSSNNVVNQLTGYAAFTSGPKIDVGNINTGNSLEIVITNWGTFDNKDNLVFKLISAKDSTGTVVLSNVEYNYSAFTETGTGSFFLDTATLSISWSGTGTDIHEVTWQLFERPTIVPFLVQDGVVLINTAVIGSAAITDAMIQSLSASKISTTNLAALSADLGTVTAGKLESTDGDFIIDLTNKQISISV